MIGGGEIYKLAMPMAHRIFMTRVHAQLDGDAFFPHPEAIAVFAKKHAVTETLVDVWNIGWNVQHSCGE